jgi:hypothetical protein
MPTENTDKADIDTSTIRPFGSAVVLECIDDDVEGAFAQVIKMFRRAAARTTSRRNLSIIQSGIVLSDSAAEYRLDQVDGVIYRVDQSPSWLSEIIFTDTKHHLAIAMRRERLIAIHANGPMVDSIQSWVDDEAGVWLRKINGRVLEGALLQGEAKGLWLRGAHARRRSKADNKVLNGISVGETLNPRTDQSYTLSAARSNLEKSADRTVVHGVVGCTPRKSLVWLRSMSSYVEFVVFTVELLRLIESKLGSPIEPTDSALGVLAHEVSTLDGVSGAYEVVCLAPDDASGGPDATDQRLEAAETLESAALHVTAIDGSADFYLDAGCHGSVAGRLRARVSLGRAGARINFGEIPGRPATDWQSLRVVREALRYASDLVTVYYKSGHSLVDGKLIEQSLSDAPFRRWEFHDFAGFNIEKEKPNSETSAEMFARIGSDGDDSLFGWVARSFKKGWLTCDDGSGEVADFVHIGPDDPALLSLIHVKRAGSSWPNRGASAGAYEVVASQAAKNVRYLDSNSLMRQLGKPAGRSRPTWIDGVRVADRSEFLEMLEARDPREPSQVIIVQPHLTQSAYERIGNSDRNDSEMSIERLRLALVETLLNSLLGTVSNEGAELRVYGSNA